MKQKGGKDKKAPQSRLTDKNIEVPEDAEDVISSEEEEDPNADELIIDSENEEDFTTNMGNMQGAPYHEKV